MTLEQAKKFLHPATAPDAIAEINDFEERTKAVTEACLAACEAIDKLERLEKWIERYAENDLR